MWLAVKRGASFAAVGRVFNRDHTTVMHAYRKLEQPGAADAAYGSFRDCPRYALGDLHADGGEQGLLHLAPPGGEVDRLPGGAEKRHRAGARKPSARRAEYPRAGAYYDLIEDGVILALHSLGLSDSDISIHLDRPKDGVMRRRRELGGSASRTHPYTREECASLRRLWLADAAIDTICRMLRRSRDGVRRKAHELGLPARRKAWPAEEEQRVAELWKQGESQRAIARVTGYTVGQVAGRLTALGLFGRRVKEDGAKGA
jgi:hypothetical protein